MNAYNLCMQYFKYRLQQNMYTCTLTVHNSFLSSHMQGEARYSGVSQISIVVALISSCIRYFDGQRQLSRRLGLLHLDLLNL